MNKYTPLATSRAHRDQRISPTRPLEMASDRFGAFEAIAHSSIKLARVALEEEFAMDVLSNEALL